MNADDELLAIFHAEVHDLREQLAAAVERDPASWDVLSLRRVAHTLKGSARLAGARALETTAHLIEELLGPEAQHGRAEGAAGVIRHGAHLIELAATDLEAPLTGEVAAYRRLVEAVLASAQQRADVATLQEAVAAHGGVEPENTQQGLFEPAPREGARMSNATIRVASEKIERLMAVSSDYVTAGHSLAAQAVRMSELLAKLDTFMRRMPELRAKPELRELRRSVALLDEELAGTRRRYVQMTAELQDGVRQLRMLRIDAVRNVFARAVAEMARSEGKRAEFATVGGDTEVDRAVLEGLRDPLVHLIRNAIAHGIEPEAERVAAGKPAQGTITLRAWSTRASVVVELADDGRGIDTSKIVETAVARRLIQPEAAATIDDRAARELLFAPGFSTLSRAGDLAGRGVGLDVVRRNLEQLGGSVSCESKLGRGATFRVELPLTRLTTRAIHVRLGRHDFLMLATQVVRTCLVTSGDLHLSDGQEVLFVDGNPVAVLRLEQAFGFRSEGRDQRVAVVVGEEGRQKAVLVDELAGETEVLVQPLGWNLKAVRGIAGAAVLEGHRVLPVLNAAELVSFASAGRSAHGHGESARNSGQRKVLVVDDSITSRTLLKNILSSAGYAIEVAVDGEDGWSKLTQERFDVVVTDVEMPRLTGFELTRRIRSDAKLRSCTVILCTSLGNEAEKRTGAEAGADAYIVKGAFDQDELLAALARLLPGAEGV